ncbi:MAG: Eco57I restriction-modification methylase domain-containing protein [Methyloprofundus sp.]|nr:Eco57I restriction-modification methylase domain-containing protein [Methyloprofundus sp.]
MSCALSLDKESQKQNSQYFTPLPIAKFLASLFVKLKGNISLLDPGSGSGILSYAVVEESLCRRDAQLIELTTYDISPAPKPFLDKTCRLCSSICDESNVIFKHKHYIRDFIIDNMKKRFSHAIINPPYQKISASSPHRKVLKELGIDTVNLYAGFVSKAIKMLEIGGELVAIIPRSFCNGPYYESFRKHLLTSSAITHIHIFDSRKDAFYENQILQENIIIHCIKGHDQGNITISSSRNGNFYFDTNSQSYIAEGMTIRTVPFENVIKRDDKSQFIHIPKNDIDQAIIERAAIFQTTLNDLGVEVSTGPIVGFRLKEFLVEKFIPNHTAAVIYPSGSGNEALWPLEKKPSSIKINEKTKKLLWENSGTYLLVNRFSSKEQARRIVAMIYSSSTTLAERVGFDNKINVFHKNKRPIHPDLAKGLFVFLNSSLIDKYYRCIGGHTQVNASDLKYLKYPDYKSLIAIGQKVNLQKITQLEIDKLIDEEVVKMTNESTSPLNTEDKIQQAIWILNEAGMPKEQLNERSALTLLALADLKPADGWSSACDPMIGVTPIMDWMKEQYGKNYAPNTRETIRRQTLHQFVEAGICLYNPDKPDRAVNSPKACYQLEPEFLGLIKKLGLDSWKSSLDQYLNTRDSLVAQYAKEREMLMIPLVLSEGNIIKLSAGDHSQLISDIVTEFGPRFAPGSEIIYLGDTGAKQDFYDEDRLKSLGVTLDKKGKLPDVVLYWQERNWLFLIESVTSHGPVDNKRYIELTKLFEKSTAGLVFVTAFPDKRTMNKFLPSIAWETEVWVAEAPTHMVHFNGDRFLGPHK